MLGVSESLLEGGGKNVLYLRVKISFWKIYISATKPTITNTISRCSHSYAYPTPSRVSRLRNSAASTGSSQSARGVRFFGFAGQLNKWVVCVVQGYSLYS